jgi:hypothetical protein
MSTPLESLSDNQGPPADEERVRRILADLNGAEPQRIITEPPNTMSTGTLRMDPGTARANVIGNSTPTMADFHAMFQQMSPGGAPQQSAPQPQVQPKADPSWKDYAYQLLRAPMAVVVIVFLLNLPVTTGMLSKYASWMYLSTGEISVGGLLVKSLLAGSMFALYQVISAFIDK